MSDKRKKTRLDQYLILIIENCQSKSFQNILLTFVIKKHPIIDVYVKLAS